MNANDIKFCIDNSAYIYEQLEKVLQLLPQEAAEQLEELFENGNINEVYNTIITVAPNFFSENGITLSSLKLLSFLNDNEAKSKLFSEEEFTSILKNIVDIYGDKISEIMNTNLRNFNMSILDSLLSLNDLKYTEIYKSILLKKLSSTTTISDGINVIKNANPAAIDKDMINTFISNYNYHIPGKDAIEFLKVLPNSILQDGNIAINMLEKIDNIFSGDEKILDYIPASLYSPEFSKSIMAKAKYNFSAVFDYIPMESRTREMWEMACNYDYTYLNKIPSDNIDPTISQEEYTIWLENLISEKIISSPDSLEIFSTLSAEKKTVSLCQKIADSISFSNNSSGYNDLLKEIPENSRTQRLYETLVAKSPSVLKDIPIESFISNLPQDQYDKWLENLIANSIENSQDMTALYYSIPRKKINERIWNEWLDKCIQQGADRDWASISIVPFENLTPQMVDRAMKEIYSTELYKVPCIDRNLDELSETERELYAKWQSSFSEEQKQAYRKWYEQTWIKFLNETKGYGSVYLHMPKEAITAEINRACIDIDVRSIDRIPLPETPEKLQEYQQLLIYALGKMPTIDYKDYRITLMYGDRDILENIPKVYINQEIVRAAIEKNTIYLSYANPTDQNFRELLDIAYKNKLESIGRTELTEKEKELMQQFALNNAELFKTLKLEILDPKIVSAIGVSSLEKITRYEDVQYFVLGISKDEAALKTFGFALENLKMDNIFIEPLIEKLSRSISAQKSIPVRYNEEEKQWIYKSTFLDLVSQRIDRKDIPFTDYEKVIISYLTLNPQEGRKITNYEDILNFVERKNKELENIVSNSNSTLIEVKNAYLERLVGLNYETAANLVKMYGNDPEQLLKNYKNVNPESFKELGEKEALEIIIKIKSLIETQDINAIRSEFQKCISQERKEESFLRYQKSTILETSLRRAYGRDMVDSLSKNTDLYHEQELEFDGKKYLVRKVDGEFNRMVSLLGAYRKSSTNEGDMYDRWNTNQMANNHALCYSLINQSNPGTAMIDGKKGVIISINGFSPESIFAAAPYDLCSDNRHNTAITWRQQRFFSTQNMPNQTRAMYSEYDIEIQDVLSDSDKYQKIQPATIICFEEVDEDSIRAAIELGEKLGHPIPIELIDRRELARNEMIHIINAFNNFKSEETINTALVQEIITRFNNVRNAHRFSNLSDELLGENKRNENKKAPFNIENLNQMLNECLATVEKKIRSGQVEKGLQALEDIKSIIAAERQKSFLMPTMYEKQLWTGISLDIDYKIDEIQRTYGKPIVKPLEEIKSLSILSQMQGKELASVTFDVTWGRVSNMPEQLSANQVMQSIDIAKIRESISELHSQGFYQGNKSYDEEHISRVILYSDVISKMEGFDDKTRKLLTEVAKYYSCGRQLDIAEKHEQYSAKLAGKELAGKYSSEDTRMIQAAIELQNFKSSSGTVAKMQEERNAKLIEICGKYGINEEQSVIVSKMASCISDSVKLDQTRFVDKAKDKASPEQSFWIENLESASAKKLIKFSYSMQEQLAQQQLEQLASFAHIDFDTEKAQIMKDFFTEVIATTEKKTKDDAITQSPIVRLEYLKKKYPELEQMDLDSLFRTKQVKDTKAEIKNAEKLQLQSQRRDLRRRQFEARINELGLNIESVMTLDKLFEQQEILQQLEASVSSKKM